MLVNNNRSLPSIICVQRKANKIVPKKKDMLKTYKEAFGDEIGFTTNIITSQFEVQSHFDPDSDEFKELDYRIICGQLYQQNCIDKLKGIVAKPMPKHWYSRKENNIHPEDSLEDRKQKNFNQSIVADKKPYFMIYIYPQLKKEYETYQQAARDKCLIQFGTSLDKLITKSEDGTLTNEESMFLDSYYKFMPVGTGNCVMNQICYLFEKEFDGYLKKLNDKILFDYTILKRGVEYSNNEYYALRQLYQSYSKRMSSLTALSKAKGNFDINISDVFENRITLFRESVQIICPDREKACDILLDLCYKNQKSKQFVWDMFGDVITERLLERNYYQITYPVKTKEDSEFEYDGEEFRLETIKKIEASVFEEVDYY